MFGKLLSDRYSQGDRYIQGRKNPSLKMPRKKFHGIPRESVAICIRIQIDWDPEASVDTKKVHCNVNLKNPTNLTMGSKHLFWFSI